MGLISGIGDLVAGAADTAEEFAADQMLQGYPGYGDYWEYDKESPIFGSVDATESGYRAVLFLAMALAAWGWFR